MNGETMMQEHLSADILSAIALGDDAGREVMDHIQSCPACSKELQELRAVTQSLAELPDTDLPRNLYRKLVRAVRLKRRPVYRVVSRAFSFLFKHYFAAVLAMAFLVIFLYIFFTFVL